MLRVLAAWIFAFAFAFAAHAQPAADLVLRNGTIYTVDAANPSAQSLAIRNGEIVAVGTDAEVELHIRPGTEVIDLEGRMVLPGLHDVHTHLLEANHPAFDCLLTPDLPPEQYIPELAACQPNPAANGWVVGAGHSIVEMLTHIHQNSGRPPVEILDDAIPNAPALILESTSHSVWVNSAALTALGIGPGTPDPQGGIILRDLYTNLPNGLLFDAAGELATEAAFQANPALAPLDLQAVQAGVALANQNGITSAADARGYWTRGHVEAWQAAEAQGSLTLRAIVGLWAYPDKDDAGQLADLAARYSNAPNSRLRFSQVKIYSDGEVSHTTAALLEPYQRGAAVGPATGLHYFPQARLTQYVTELERVGFDLHIHAIGDRGVHEALDAIEAAGDTNCGGPTPLAPNCGDRRHRLTHVELVQPSDVVRFPALGVIADFQMSSDFVLPQHRYDSAFELGTARIDERLLRLRTLYDAGARIVLSSDYDVGPMSPFVGMQNALNRGAQSLPTLDSAIRAYTIDAAYLMRQESRTGSIEVGKLADLIVLDRDITTLPTSQIASAQVLLTLLGGAEVWRSSSAILQPRVPIPPSVPSMGGWWQLLPVAAIGTLVWRCWRQR